MKIRLLSVGKPRDLRAQALHDDYASRLVRLGVVYEAAQVAEVRQGSRFSAEHVKEREAGSLLDRLARDDSRCLKIALDEHGDALSSRQLAALLEPWSTRTVTFVVGGPLGLHDDLLRQVDHRLSLSAMTFPHELVRVVLVEQVYRALTILRRIPYHK